MKKNIVIVLIVIISCIAISCSKPDDKAGNDATINSENQGEIVQYTDNSVINNFVSEFNKKSNDAMSDFKSLSVNYSCDFNGYYTTIDLYDNKIQVSVNADSEKHDMSELKDEFVELVVFMDGSITENDAEIFYDTLITGGVAKEDVKIGKVELYYCPTLELSNGLSPGRFDLTTEDKAYL